MQNEQVIQTLASHTQEKAFTDGLRLRGVIRSCENLNGTRLRNPCEGHPELALSITDEILRSLTKGGGDPSLLCGPSVGGTSCDADMDYSSGAQFDEEESEQRVEEEVRDSEEVAGPDLLGMSA